MQKVTDAADGVNFGLFIQLFIFILLFLYGISPSYSQADYPG